MTLAGRIAVVTGATSGLGAATARRLTAAGAAVALLGRREDRLEALAEELPGSLAVPADVRDLDSLRHAADRIRTSLGRPDLVVANAGVMFPAPYESADVSEWTTMIDTNVTGLLWTGRAFADDLLAAAAEGRPADLVHVGSIGGHGTFEKYAVYCATKAAVAHLTRNLRLEFGPRGVRVRTVEPGLVPTELGDGMTDTGQKASLADWRTRFETLRPGDIAEAITWSATMPPRMNVADLVVVPTAQG